MAKVLLIGAWLLCICPGLRTAWAEPPGSIWIAAHRGAKNSAPENTVSAFEAAARLGADYIELDVRRTRDGQLVIMHDSKVDRTTNGHGAVADLSLQEILKLDAGQQQRVPTFRDALLWAKRRGVRIDVDHKSGDVDEIAAVIRETGMTKRVVIEGPRERLTQFAAQLPGVDTMPKVTTVEDVRAVCASLHTTVVRLSLAQLVQPEYPSVVRQCGARVSVTILGTTDTEEEMRRVIQAGAQMIETDRSDLLAKIRSSLPKF